MKKIFFYAGVIAFAAALAACDKKDDNNGTPEEVVSGVTWAACNVDEFQQFAARPDMYTKFYQWNRSTAWSATDESVTGWVENIPDQAWTVNPCPEGWRLPTSDDFSELYRTGFTWAEANTRGNAVAGMFYGANHATATISNLNGCVFLPAVGMRNHNGLLGMQGADGNYWSSTHYDNESSYSLFLRNSGSTGTSNLSPKVRGYSIRCVK